MGARRQSNEAPRVAAAVILLAAVTISPVSAQAPATPSTAPASCLPRGFLPAPASYQSVEQLPDRRVTFRMCAPDATSVSVVSNDIADLR
jgi:enterochelin esterase family protein